jgi:phenylalanyl-tRNA synthetase beta chain
MEPAKATVLSFPMSSDRTTIRMNLISGLLDDVAYNQARKVSNVALYEEGRVFYRQADQERPREVEHIAAALTDEFSNGGWHDRALKVDFFVVKGIVEFFLSSLGVADVRFEKASGHEEMHPGRTADIYVKNEFIGFVGEVHPAICEEYRIGRTYVFELDLQKIIDLPKQVELYQPVSKYPAVTRDIALAVDKSVENGRLVDYLYAHGGKYLVQVELFDVYEGKGIAPNKKSLAYKLTYQAKNTTLSDEVVNTEFGHVVKLLQADFNAQIR